MHVESKATDPTWIYFVDADGKKLMVGLLEPAEPKTFDLNKIATLRTGNAGGLVVNLNGKSIGPIGPRGYVRQIEFKDGGFKLTAPQ
jgi:hypothetical protein